jgi:hypothetical protein
MNTCSLSASSQSSAASQGQLQQAANHTFYPWMAIAGKCFPLVFPLRVSPFDGFDARTSCVARCSCIISARECERTQSARQLRQLPSGRGR